MKVKYRIGDKVHWNDPDDGNSSGEYVIKLRYTKDGKYSVYLLGNDFSEVEAFACEMNLIYLHHENNSNSDK